MKISITEAKAQLTELVRRAEAGDDVILTRHGHPSVRLVAVRVAPTAAQRRELLERFRVISRQKTEREMSAARSQDFLYDDDGLPA